MSLRSGAKEKGGKTVTIPLQKNVVYGPVHSRRFGNSLGINILPAGTKFCLSNCIYCQYGCTDPEAMRFVKLRRSEDLLSEIKEAFIKRSFEKVRPNSITFSGNGEPTLHPEFGKIVREVKNLRDMYFPKVPIVALSDSSRVHLPEVREALEELDERYMKLDAGDPETYRKINCPLVKTDWQGMIRGLARLSRVSIQSLFIAAPFNNATCSVLPNWLRALTEIRPYRLQVYTISRDTRDPRVRPMTQKRLSEIAHLACQVTDLSAVISVTETHVELA